MVSLCSKTETLTKTPSLPSGIVKLIYWFTRGDCVLTEVPLEETWETILNLLTSPWRKGTWSGTLNRKLIGLTKGEWGRRKYCSFPSYILFHLLFDVDTWGAIHWNGMVSTLFLRKTWGSWTSQCLLNHRAMLVSCPPWGMSWLQLPTWYQASLQTGVRDLFPGLILWIR